MIIPKKKRSVELIPMKYMQKWKNMVNEDKRKCLLTRRKLFLVSNFHQKYVFSCTGCVIGGFYFVSNKGLQKVLKLIRKLYF